MTENEYSRDSNGNMRVMGDATPNMLGKFFDAEDANSSLKEETSAILLVKLEKKAKLRTCNRIAAQLLLNVCLAVLSGCRHGEVGREGIACDYVVKDADAFARDFGSSLDCYVNEVRDVFGDKDLASFFEPEGCEFYMPTTRMRLKCTVRLKS